MPNCDFLAAGTDHKTILQFVFTDLDCRVYELASKHNQRLREFRTLADMEEHYLIRNWSRSSNIDLHLQLHAARSGGKLVKRRINFYPEAGGGFRYDSEGWGLIQLYLRHPHKGELGVSHTNHNSERRALVWETAYTKLGPVSDWNWPVVTSTSRRLNNFIRSMAVKKIGSRCVLPHAAELEKSGIVLGRN